MIGFVKYPHLERLGNVEVEAIEVGTCHVFPKLDGTNASMWLDVDDQFYYGSRTRTLSLDKDNAGFMAAMEGEQGRPYRSFLKEHRDIRLFGEWLVPHTLKDYREDAWRKFYVFDCYDEISNRFLPYSEYKPLLTDFPGVEFIPCIKVINNGTREDFTREIQAARFLLKDECTNPEGIVIKNYQWDNKFQRQTWAKIIATEFKDAFDKQWDPAVVNQEPNEAIIANSVVTLSLVEKEYAKIALNGWSSKSIPQLLETVFHCVVTEELYSNWKLVKFGSINGKALRNFVYMRVKQLKPEIF